jgi:hypothetical protein
MDMLKRLGVVLMVAAALASQGCSGIGMGGRGTAAQDVNYTLDGIAYRTFTAPIDTMRRVTLTTFKRMDIVVKRDGLKEDGIRELIAAAGDRTIYVELEKLSERTTRMRITAKHGWMWRDRATAAEIIVQTGRTLDGTPAVMRRGGK